jgi:hypothetical protein
MPASLIPRALAHYFVPRCTMSETTLPCSRCERLGKPCTPRLTAVHSNAKRKEQPDLSLSDTKRHRRSFASHSSTFNEPDRDPNFELETSVDVWNLFNDSTTIDTDAPGKPKRQLSELMGYNPEKQRSEYMKARRLASQAAKPLLLDKAWRRYSKAEKQAALERVSRAFHQRVFLPDRGMVVHFLGSLRSCVNRFCRVCAKVMLRTQTVQEQS